MLDFLLGNDLLSAIIAFVLVLIPAVIVHELGHFFAARAIGVTVLEFGIGFPPRITRLFTWRETEFTLNAIPLGGFVRPLGEDMVRPVGEEATEQDRQEVLKHQEENRREENYLSEREELEARGITDIKAVHEAKPWPRIFFMAAGAIANFIFAFLVFVLIALLGLPEPVGARLGLVEVPPDSPLEAVGLEAGDLIETVNGNVFISTSQLFEFLAASEGRLVELGVRRTATASVEELTIEVVPSSELVEFLATARGYVLITGVDENSPAEEAGLRPGDLVSEMNGFDVTDAPDPALRLQQLTEQFAGEEVTLSVIRDGQTLEISLVPRLDPPSGSGRIGVGIRAEFTNPEQTFTYIEGIMRDYVPQALPASVSYGVDRTTEIFGIIAEFPARLIGGSTQPEERRIVSVVGVSQLGGAILQDTIAEDQFGIMLEYIALISIALGFTNLLPIPALDGGRILFVIVELIRGKPISPEREGYVHMVGLFVLLTAAVFLIINDLLNPLTDLLP